MELCCRIESGGRQKNKWTHIFFHNQRKHGSNFMFCVIKKMCIYRLTVVSFFFYSISALGGSSALHIPAFPSGGCLIDYVPQVCQLLTNKVNVLGITQFTFTLRSDMCFVWGWVSVPDTFQVKDPNNQIPSSIKLSGQTIPAFGPFAELAVQW